MAQGFSNLPYIEFLKIYVGEFSFGTDVWELEIDGRKFEKSLIDAGVYAYSYLRQYIPLLDLKKLDPIKDSNPTDTVSKRGLYHLPRPYTIRQIFHVIPLDASKFFPQYGRWQPLLYSLASSWGGILNIDKYLGLLNTLQNYNAALGSTPTIQEVNIDGERYIRMLPLYHSPLLVSFFYNKFDHIDREEWDKVTLTDLELNMTEANWVRDYTLALVAEKLAELRGRFQTSVGAGAFDIRLNADVLLEKARKKPELEAQLRKLAPKGWISFSRSMHP